MSRKDFYREYYHRTDRRFSDKTVWGKKEREEAWRKGQCFTSKLERKIFIVVQYLVLLLCWIPLCFDRTVWGVIPVAFFFFVLGTCITQFSILKIELLYFIYRKNSVYCSVLHDIFFGNYADFINPLTRFTKKAVSGYVFTSGGSFYGKFSAVCRNKNAKIVLRFQINGVVVAINKKKIAIKDALTSKEQLIKEIAAVINT